MSRFIDLVGHRFGRLIVLEYAGHAKSNLPTWRCVCDCGKEALVLGCNLRTGNTTSCGCYQDECRSENTYRHGMAGKRLERIYAGMKIRCYDKNATNYPLYGGRGITICQEWLDDVVNFIEWSLANGYSDDLTIDRIDVSKGYSPQNCRWVDRYTQANNKTDSHFVEIDGERHTISEWSRISGVNHTTILYRVNHGYTGRDIIRPAK